MSKIRKSILIIGILVIAIAASLGTALAFYATGTIKTDPIELVYSVKDAQKVYDGTPLKATEYRLTSGELGAGHTAQVEVLGQQTTVGVSRSDLSVKIYDSEGYNVTNNYSIKVLSGELEVTKKSISIDLPSQKAVYNGTTVELTNYRVTEYSQGDLVAGHKIFGSTDAGLLNVGDTVPEKLTPLIFDAIGNNVTENYEIDFTVGEIEVVPRYISVRPVSVSKMYDGTQLVAEDIEYVEGSLADGQYVKYEINNNLKNALLDANIVETRITSISVYTVIDGEEVDVTDNYEIDTFETGVLEISPRPLTVTAKSGSWIYDGTVHTLKDDTAALSVEGLAPTDELIDVQYNGTITNVGTAVNYISNVSLSCYSENYKITYVYGVLEVTPYELTITTATDEKYYDGAALSNGNVEGQAANKGHEIVLADGADYPEITNAGSVRNSFECAVQDESGKNVTANYIINYEYGTLTVKKLPVAAVLGKDEVVTYNGEEQLPDLMNEEYFTLQSFDAEHTAALALSGKNFSVVSYAKTMQDVGEYAYSVKFNDSALALNYELEVPDNGYFTISPKNISVLTASDEKTYDGTPLFKGASEITDGGLVLGHSVTEPVNLPSITNKGVINNEYAVTISNADGADVTKNYKIDYEYGTLTVNALDVTVTLAQDIQRTYSGKAVTLTPDEAISDIVCADGSLSERLLAKSDFTVIFEEEVVNVKRNAQNVTVAYNYGVKITDAKLSENFILHIQDGSLVVKPAAVTAKIKDITQVYDAQTHLLDVYTAIYSVEDSVTGLTRDDFTVVMANNAPNSGVLLNAAEYPYKVELQEEKKGNYDLTVKNVTTGGSSATYTIEQYVVEVVTASKTFIYDGSAHTCKEFTSTPLASRSHFVSVSLADSNLPNVTDVSQGKVENELSFYAWESTDAINPSNNYEIVVTCGYLEVVPCNVTVRTPSATRAYNGEAFSSTDDIAVIGANDEFTAQVDGSYPEIINVGTLSNVFECAILQNGTDVTENFEISYEYGTLEVTPLNVTVTLNNITDGENNDLNNSLVYDGTEKKISGINNAIAQINTGIMGLLSVNDFEIVYGEPMIDAGVYGYSVKIADSDLAKNFTLAVTDGTVTVSKMTVTVLLMEYTGNNALTFNNTAKTFGAADVFEVIDEYNSSVSEELFDTSALTFKEYNGKVVKDAGNYSYYVELTDENYKKNFVVQSSLTDIEVKKLSVNVTLKDYTGDSAFVFDNTVKTLTAFDAILEIKATVNGREEDTDLISYSDFRITVADDRVIKNNGDYGYEAELINKVYAANFDITCIDGNVTVNKLDVNVYLKDYKFDYNGEEFVISARDTVLLDTGLLLPTCFNFELSYLQENANGTTTKTEAEKVLNAGKYFYKAIFNTKNITDETSEFYDNFNLNCEEAEITVNKLKIELTLASYVKTFDNELFELSAMKAVSVNSKLINNNADRQDFEISYYSVNSVDKTNTPVLASSLLNAGEYCYKVALTKENAVNFEIEETFGDGSIVIEKLDITVTLDNIGEVYDGKTKAVPNNSILDTGADWLASTDFTVSFNVVGDVVNVGEYPLKAVVDGRKTPENYNVTIEGGCYTVTPAPLNISTPIDEKTYDGKALYKTEGYTSVGLLTGHAVVVDEYTSITDVCKVDNVFKVSVTDAFGADLTENYDISYTCGTLEITPRQVNVTLKEFTGAEAFTYDGEEIKFDEFKADAIKLDIIPANGETVAPALISANDFGLVCESKLLNAGKYKYTVKFNGNAENFDFNDYNEAEFDINKMELSVALASMTDDNALPYIGTDYANLILGGNWLNGNINIGENYEDFGYQDFKLVYNGEMKNVGKYSFGVEFVNSAYYSNYNLFVGAGYLQVRPLSISLSLKDYTGENDGFVYNGKKVTLDAYDAITGDISLYEDLSQYFTEDFLNDFDIKTLISKNEFSIDYISGEMIYVKDGNYTYGVEITSAESAKNFDVNYSDGVVEILKRTIRLTLQNLVVTDISDEVNSLGYGATFDVTHLVGISSGTPLADGDTFSVTDAFATGNEYDYTITLEDYEPHLTHADCYIIDDNEVKANLTIIYSDL